MSTTPLPNASVQTRLFYLKVSRNGNYAKRRLGLLLPMDLLEILADYSAKLGSSIHQIAEIGAPATSLRSPPDSVLLR